MMVFSHAVWCGAVVVVVFVVVVCLFLFFWCVGALLGVWDNMVVLVDHSRGFRVECGWLCAGCASWDLVVGVLCENCIVDASNLYSLIVLGVLFVTCVLFVKGTRWMPWHYEPMKDV
ncbi:hypothetical protein CIP107508_02226 [Corynebacterium diphtheriae]|nr:hypothetical protein CIP107508_02226 [Corynebacterium diphtheriae]